MKKLSCLLSAAMFALSLPSVVLANPTETTPAVNQADSDFVVGKKAINSSGWEAAVESFNKALKADPENADIHNYLGYAYRHLGQMENSFSHYDSALRINPRHLGAHAYVGQAYLLVGKVDKAGEHLAILEKIGGKDCDEYKDLARAIAAYRK